MTLVTHLKPSLSSPQGLNERELGKKLRVVKRGRADGVANTPASDAQEINELELSIITSSQHAIDDIGQWLKRRLKEIAKSVAELAPSATERDVESPIGEARFELAKLCEERRDHLAGTFARLRQSARELSHFKRANRLTHRNASYGPAIYGYGAALLLLLCESALNMRNFAEVSDFGLLGGASMAVTFAMVNLLLGYLVIGALGLRYMNHVSLFKRLCGWFATLTGTGLALAYNTYLAHYRAAIETAPDAAAFAEIGSRMLANPAAFIDHNEALVLFAIGLLSVLAFALKGYLLTSDVYPGYKPVDRTHKKAEDAYEAAKLQFRNAAEAVVARKIEVIDTRFSEADAKTRRAIDFLNRAEIDAQTAEQAATESRHVAQRLIAKYRAENAAVRDTAPPAYFRRLPDFEAELTGLPPLDFPAQRTARLDDIAELRQAAGTAKEDLRRLAMETLEQITNEVSTAETEGERRVRAEEADLLPAPMPKAAE